MTRSYRISSTRGLLCSGARGGLYGVGDIGASSFSFGFLTKLSAPGDVLYSRQKKRTNSLFKQEYFHFHSHSHSFIH